MTEIITGKVCEGQVTDLTVQNENCVSQTQEKREQAWLFHTHANGCFTVFEKFGLLGEEKNRKVVSLHSHTR